MLIAAWAVSTWPSLCARSCVAGLDCVNLVVRERWLIRVSLGCLARNVDYMSRSMLVIQTVGSDSVHYQVYLRMQICVTPCMMHRASLVHIYIYIYWKLMTLVHLEWHGEYREFSNSCYSPSSNMVYVDLHQGMGDPCIAASI